MAEVQKCRIPEDLYYWVEKHVWLRLEDGVATIGLTAVAAHLARRVIAVTIKQPGRAVERGKSLATVESGKWVGPVPAPVSGSILEVNQTLKGTPELINQDPYGAGWVVKMAHSKLEEEKGYLLTGEAAVEAYRKVIEAEGIVCG